MNDIIFFSPNYFYLFILIPLLIAWQIWKEKKRYPTLNLSSTEGFAQTGSSLRLRFRHILFVLRLAAISMAIVALARPQSSSTQRNVTTEGIDIVVTLDISTSMLSEDFSPNRIEAAKKTALKFVQNRPDDRIGLIVFSGKSYTQCPITTDHDVIENLFESLKVTPVDDGTAIGLGLATAVSRLKDSKAKSKVVILLTDGVNNTGFIAPLTAADIAKNFNVRVYTIGVGTRGVAPYPIKTPYGVQYQNMPVDIDEDVLKQIASATGGKYYRATNNKTLAEIYEDIDKLEKTRIDVSEFSRHAEEFLPFAIAAAVLFLLEILLRLTIYKKIP